MSISQRESQATISLRVSSHLWMDDERRAELLELLRERRDTIWRSFRASAPR